MRPTQALIALAAALVVVVAAVGAFVIFRPKAGSHSANPSSSATPNATASPMAPPTPKGSVPAPSNGRFSADGVSFRYPQGLAPLDHVPYRLPSGNLRWVTAVGFNASDFVLVGKLRLAHKANQDAQHTLAETMAGDATSQLTSGHFFREIVGATVNHLNGYAFAIAGTNEKGTTTLEDWDVVLFSGRSAYFKKCGMTNFTEQAVGYACGVVLGSFKAS